MKQELAWGTAAAMAIVAAMGISLQSGSKPGTNASAEQPTRQTSAKSSKTTKEAALHKDAEPYCSDSISLLEHFYLLQEQIVGPDECYAPGKKPSAVPLDAALQPDFIIATFPDPVHTHFSLLFDRFVEALQQGLQDEGYQYDSSWLPWEMEEPSFSGMKDQDQSDERRARREDQPGILLFRNGDLHYQHAMIVFIVGEEPTRGIHRAQFENAVAWIRAMRSSTEQRTSVAILGPTFSGSFPSLETLLAKTDALRKLNKGTGLAIYSGSASSSTDGQAFAQTNGVQFRSFVEDDTTELRRICQYLQKATPDASWGLSNLAILSEDETAYGSSVTPVDTDPHSTKSAEREASAVCPDATRLYYPRDISTLRAAYQTQSIFSSGSGQQSQDNSPRKNLPTDLADPSGHQHDTVRTYAGNQTPLSQEAQLLGIVDVLRAHRTQYVILRSSNTLDPLFLANFLRRDYPEARLILLNSDLLFQRGQDAMALRGVMTLSTYPLFSWAREWTALPGNMAHSHRVFPENSSEGVYIASRMLLQSVARLGGQTPALSCEVADTKSTPPDVFAPSLRCHNDRKRDYAPLPDYGPPYWTNADACKPDSPDFACKPATWLSVITRNGTWPLAIFNEQTINSGVERTHAARLAKTNPQSTETSQILRWPDTPRSMKVLLVGLCCFALFHLMCCRLASFTAKPAFRAHFAGSDLRHIWLVVVGSYLVALMALMTGWGCGIFNATGGPPTNTWPAWIAVVFVCLVSGVAIVANIIVTRKLSGHVKDLVPSSAARIVLAAVAFCLLIWAFFGVIVHPLENALSLATRAFAYWRSMNLTSGVSPIVPFLCLILGFYFWFWYALHGLALFGPDRPRLPRLQVLQVQVDTQTAEKLPLSMFSQDTVGDPAEHVARPLARGHMVLTLGLFGCFLALTAVLASTVPVRSLGARDYGRIFWIALLFYCSVVLADAWQIWRTWSYARQLLVFLDRLALRRTLSALHGFSWGTVWKMSGNVLDVRYKLLSRQLECLTHLHNSLRLFKTPTDKEEKEAFSGIEECKTAVAVSRGAGLKFADWYATNYNEPGAADLSTFEYFQAQIAETTGVTLTKLLVPASRVEKLSLVQVDPQAKADQRNAPPPSKNELIRNAEELVCLTYLGFIQNLLGRIRTMVLGGVYLFISLCIAVASYPFDPRTLLSGILLLLFVAFGGAVVFVYADMHRDTTLSVITNTQPGELGSQFWFKVAAYGAAPIFGLLTQIFPEWAGYLFSWLQPGLSSLK